MKKSVLFLFFFVASIVCGQLVYSWGFFAHKEINKLAVMTLPTDMVIFYKKNIGFVSEHAVDPDKRRYASENEAPRHFIDIDHFSKDKPFKVMPRRWDEAVAKFTEDTLQAYGIVPWHISKVTYWLTKAFEEESVDDILRLSADLGHYVGDAHVPLHTTENYNGQMTNQRGIHGFWESRLPELNSKDYDFLVGKATYIESPLDAAWEAIEDSHTALDSVLSFEEDLTLEFPSDNKYGFESRGASTVRVYSEDFSQAYHARLNGMVERRMRAAILMTGSLWYTAWVNAGKPDLEKLNNATLSEKLQSLLLDLDKSYQGGKIKGREHDH